MAREGSLFSVQCYRMKLCMALCRWRPKTNRCDNENIH